MTFYVVEFIYGFVILEILNDMIVGLVDMT